MFVEVRLADRHSINTNECTIQSDDGPRVAALAARSRPHAAGKIAFKVFDQVASVIFGTMDEG